MIKASDQIEKHTNVLCKLENGLDANIKYGKWDIDNFNEHRPSSDLFKIGSIVTGRIAKINFPDKDG